MFAFASTSRSSMLRRPPLFLKFRSGINYITFTVAFGLMVDLATYGLIIPVLPFRLRSLGYHNVSERSSYLVAAYAAGLIISSVPIGILGEMVKSRKLPLLFCLLFLVGSLLLFWLCKSFSVLVVSRILQGFSGTGLWTLGLALICDTVPEDRLGVIMGYVMIGWSIGSVLGPLAGGTLYASLGYHSIFIFAITITGIDFLLRLFVLDKQAIGNCGFPQLAASEKKDSSGCTTDLTQSNQVKPLTELPMIVPTLTPPPKQEESVSETSTNQATGSLPLHNPKQHQAKTTKALLSLIQSARCWTLFMIIFVMGFAFGGLLDAGMTLLVHSRYGLSSKGASLVFIGAIIPSFASSPLAGHFADRYGAKWPVLVCLVLGTPFFALLALHGRLYTFILWISLAGLFVMGIATPIMEDLSQVVKITPGLGYAHVYGIFNMFYSIGALVGPMCVGTLLEHYGVQKGWRISCLLCTGLCSACIFPAWLLLPEKKQTDSSRGLEASNA
ncbi:hypothetical protein O181_044516 [Austropuccinia psidii MF-1]|uniref:Major facilitator superfamily (MFS) profile domain-containing protein n=1 Tax=Austropuccinia psidii MF-1 TaxID=1389203 RepID=A0A9Q3DQJ2_9BASI|nr:hypothetical protein [Austropuccinia psidii MF-1]